jgi:hypothetical protein
MSDVSVSLGVTGKDVVLGAFSQVGAAGKQMGETFGSIAGKLAGLAAGYVSISAAIGSFNAVMAKGGQLSDFSDQTGIATGKLVILGRAFENNGMKAEDLGGVINKMQRTLVEAGDEGSKAADKIGRLGLKVSDLQAMTPDQQFETIAKAIAKIQDPTERAGAAMEIFGKSGGRTLALFSDFDGAVSQAKSEVGSFADEMDKNAKSFDGIGDGIAAIGEKLTEFTTGLLGDSIPAMTTLVDYFKSIDATSFGKSFSDSLSTGIDIALSIFTNPGNLFLAFGDALTVALKSAGNGLMNGLAFVFEWAKNYASELIPAYGDLMKSVFNAAIGSVMSFFSGKLADVFSDLAVLIPGTLGKSIGEVADKLRNSSQEAADIANVGLADAWGKISTAAANATEQTKMQSEDWLNVAGSAADLREHLTIAQESGAGVRTAMQESLDQAKLITQEASAWEKATNSIADNLSGATGSFKQFASGDSEAAGLAAMSGLKVPSGGVGPVSSAGDRVKSSAASRSSRESYESGRSPSRQRDDLLQDSDYVNYKTGYRRSEAELEVTRDTRANQAAQRDLSPYTGGDERASKSQAIDDLFRKYQRDGVDGGSPADLRKRAERDFEELVKKQKGPDPGVAPGYDNKKGGKPPESQESILAKILKALGGESKGYVQKISEGLPLQVLV